MGQPITITTERAVWVPPYYRRDFMDAMANGNEADAADKMAFFGTADTESFGDYIRVGTASISVQLLPADDQIRNAVQALQAKLEAERAEWLKKQAAIMAEISKLQALTYEAA